MKILQWDVQKFVNNQIDLMDVIYETKEDIDFKSEVLKIGRKHYTKCYIERDEKFLIVQPIKKPVFHTFREGDVEVTCPNCRYEQMDSWEQNDSSEHDCVGCGSTYSHERERYPSNRFSTRIISANKNIRVIK